MQDATNIFTNFEKYMNGFSENIADILKNFKFPEIVKDLNDADSLYIRLSKK